MSVKNHPDYKEEKERLDYTIKYIQKTLDATDTYKKLYKDTIKGAMSDLYDLDNNLGYTEILLNTEFIMAAEKNYYNYKKAKEKPYFARIDFKIKDEDKINKIYIGKTSLMKAEDDEMLIVDWRAPVANIYYEGRLGETSYETEDGLQEGELLLKRQLTVEKGQLENIFDIDITTTDEFLQASLEANADSKLKDIASTIQAEQNRVIRAEMNRPLIVQGVAGSGKTTIALHRIAYFIYRYEKTFNPENFLIIAPNNLFINYISDVLPELGVENVNQSTFEKFMLGLLGKGYKLTKPEEKLMYLIDNQDKEEDFSIWASKFKGSMEFKEIIDKYVDDIEKKFVPDKDFAIQGKVLMNRKDIESMFLKDLKYYPFHQRVTEIKKSLNNKLKLVDEGILTRIEMFYDKKINKIRREIENKEERREKVLKLIDERDKRLKYMALELKILIKKYVSNFPQDTLCDYYKKLLSKENILKYASKELNEEKIDFLCNSTNSLIDNGKIELEDLAPLIYLKHRIFGFEKKININTVVIDEAQDFSLFQFYVIKEILNTNRITILGDLSQGIHSYRAIDNWEEVLDKVFAYDEPNYMKLIQSYRTTVEVMNLANEVIKKLDNEGIVLAKPVIRHGLKPEFKEFDKEKELIEALEEKLKKAQGKQYKSIAVICKNIAECRRIKRYLDKNKVIECKILSERQKEYNAGVIIVPSYLAKGLEFDVVFITNIKETYSLNDLDIKLLYVAMTRTLHELFIYSKKGTLSLLNDIDNQLYNLE